MEKLDATWDRMSQPQIDSRTLTPPTAGAQRLANLLVIVTLAVALLLGWALKTAVEGRTQTYSDDQITFAYPATWVVDQDLDGNPMLRNPQSASRLFNDRVVVIQGDVPSSGLPAGSPLVDAATSWTLKRSSALDSFRNLSSEDGYTVAGQPAIRVNYAYVADPAAVLGRPGVPIVVKGSDLVIITGDRLTVLSGQSREADWAAFEPRFLKILEGVTLSARAAGSLNEGGS